MNTNEEDNGLTILVEDISIDKFLEKCYISCSK